MNIEKITKNNFNIQQIVERFISLKLSVFPVNMPSKKPAVKWEKFKSTYFISVEEFLDNWNQSTMGIAVVCGAISQNLEIIDFDNKLGNIKEIFIEWSNIKDVNAILSKYKFPIETTFSGGFHLFYRCSVIAGNQKLARDVNGDNKVETVIETRGEGGYVVVAPTPGYKMGHGSFNEIPVITPEERDVLLGACRMFNKYYSNYSNVENTSKKSSNKRIGDVFNQSAESSSIITDLLIKSGYKYIENKGDSMFFTRPGKKTGTSCCYNGSTFYVWSTNCTPFESERAYSNFYVYAFLKHNMDFKAAAKELAELGFKPDEDGKEKDKKYSTHLFLKMFKDDSGQIHYSIDYRLFIEFLSNAGYKRYDQKSDFIFVKVINNIVEQVYLHDIVSFILSFFEDDELNFIIKQVKTIVKKDQLISLPVFNQNFNLDTSTSVFVYFSDQYVEITKTTIETHDYEDLKDCIWKDQIINKKINIKSSSGDSDFHQFIKNVTGYSSDKTDRYYALLSAIGYMCNRYKSPSTPKVVILCDEGDPEDNDPDASRGGTGKSLICKAISHVRRTALIDGKNFNFTNQFKWQKVKEDTNVIWFDETSKWFPFEKLFSIITDDMEVEAKNQPSFTIPFNRSPKLMIATNFTIPDQSLSTKRRVHEVELSPFYNETHQPKDDFKKEFFNDWNENEWRDFYLLMFSAIQLYLSNGLMKYKVINLDNRKLAQLVDQDFQDFLDGYISDLPVDLEGFKKLYLSEFYKALDSSTNLGKKLSKSKSSRLIKKIFDFKRILFKESNIEGNRYLKFKIKEDGNASSFVF